MRGTGPCRRRTVSSLFGSSPRVRGTVPQAYGGVRRVRFIPVAVRGFQFSNLSSHLFHFQPGPHVRVSQKARDPVELQQRLVRQGFETAITRPDLRSVKVTPSPLRSYAKPTGFTTVALDRPDLRSTVMSPRQFSRTVYSPTGANAAKPPGRFAAAFASPVSLVPCPYLSPPQSRQRPRQLDKAKRPG